jgi:putative sulfotransferase
MDRFVVGTGRCGSTLLSRMLAQQPALLSVFEFFNGLDMTKRFGKTAVDGEAFAALLSQEHPIVTMVLSRGYKVEEITYPFDKPGARYTPDQGLPWLLVSTLPRFTDDPDALFDEAIAFARTLPEQHLAAHYRALFEWLAARFGRSCWLERSGSSIDYLGSLHEVFPNARFLHLHRDGPETALSMREHAAYRLAIHFVYEKPRDAEPSIDELRLLETGRGGDDPITQILESRPPLEYFGGYWSQELQHGMRAAAKLPAEQYMEVRFEDLIADPAATLRTISEFFELDADVDDWRDSAAALVRGVPPTRFDRLSADEQARLAEACRPGMELLRRL